MTNKLITILLTIGTFLLLFLLSNLDGIFGGENEQI